MSQRIYFKNNKVCLNLWPSHKCIKHNFLTSYTVASYRNIYIFSQTDAFPSDTVLLNKIRPSQHTGEHGSLFFQRFFNFRHFMMINKYDSTSRLAALLVKSHPWASVSLRIYYFTWRRVCLMSHWEKKKNKNKNHAQTFAWEPDKLSNQKTHTFLPDDKERFTRVPWCD